MVQQVQVHTILCSGCQSDNVIRFGTNSSGKQRYRCRDCKRAFVERPQKAREADRVNDPAFVAQVLATYQERASMRGVARLFKISRNTLAALLKKSQNAA